MTKEDCKNIHPGDYIESRYGHKVYVAHNDLKYERLLIKENKNGFYLAYESITAHKAI